MRRNASTVVILAGSVPREVLAAVGRSMNIALIRPQDPAADDSAGMAAAAEALQRAGRATSPYALVLADPLAEVAASWRAMWDISRQPGPVAFEQEAARTVTAWRTGLFELPDYYLVLAVGPGENEAEAHGPDFHLGPLRSARPHRVAVVAATEPAQQAVGVLHALGSLRHGPWWPGLDEVIETARGFYPDSLAGGDTALAGASAAGAPGASPLAAPGAPALRCASLSRREGPVTAGPGDETAVASRGHLRASHADREQVIDTLKAAFVQGHLAKDEFDARIGRTFASRTYPELAAITADLPAGLAAVQQVRRPFRVLSRAEMAAAWGMYGIVLTVILTIAVVPGPTTIGAIAVTAAVIYSAFWLLGGVMMVASRRSGGARVRGHCLSQARGGALPPARE
ncbi:MAG TPA: DUF1707 domain-containing protein [Streptosporangiaceae bacterium]|nr:DUF1707 domain-containing protein [Streptosporangiaceae bacterium]